VPVEIAGSANLRIAFLVRARSMHRVAVNVFDERRQDNTTTASPARIADESWRPVVFALEDFHYNSGTPDRKIDADTRFSSVFFHGIEAGASPAIWIDKLAIYRGPDRTPPAPPAEVRATTAADGSVTVQWQEPADDTFAVVYSVYRKDGASPWLKIAESLQPTYRDRPASTGTVAYRVTAADYDNNVSAASAEVTITASSNPAATATAPAKPAVQIADRMNYAEHLRTVRARRPGKVRHDVFLFAGDSITAASRYTQILGSWLARGLPVRQGVGTVTAEYGAQNIQRYLRDALPEFAVIMYGTNDVGQGLPVSQSMRHLSSIVDACLESGTIPILATIPPRGYNARSQGDQERYNRAVVELARKRRVPVSYVFEEMMQHDLKEDVLSDGIHLRPERGNDLAGRALRQTMDQVYFALRDTSGSW
jgi:lysophospholipase L1-like esterase